ncbi:MAG: FAD binding domain-containing protein [Ardenticatenia bacterium]|nr:FAD binding domain-containing protein [Ardenticatenia bacterium]
MPKWKAYHRPQHVQEALATLAHYQGRARIVAGGTDLFVELLNAPAPFEALVDITAIPELRTVRRDGPWIVVGSAVTHAEIVASPLIRRHGTALAEGCSVIGGPQVRNVATLGGNVVHALPAADGTIALLALDAEAQVASSGAGRRWIPLSHLFLGPGQSAVDATREVLTALRFRATAEREASAFGRVMRPQGVALPILAVAVAVRLDASGQGIERARVSLGPVAPVPFRSRRAEARLRGAPTSPDTYRQAAEAALEECSPRTSRYRATREYREEMITTLLPRVVEVAVARARGEAWARPRLEAVDHFSSFGAWRAPS